MNCLSSDGSSERDMPGTHDVVEQAPSVSVNNWYWDLTAYGQRFLINEVIGGADPSTLNVVLNWQAGLTR